MSSVDEFRDGVKAERVTMSGVTAVLITLAIILACVLVGFLSPTAAKVMVAFAVVSSSLWVAVDASRLRVREYKSPVAAYPFVLFSASLGFWIVMFPMYLVTRSRILAGRLPKEANPRERRALNLCIIIWCVLVAALGVCYFMARTIMGLQLSQG